MGQPQHGYTTRTARAEARPEDSGISSRQLQATRGCQVSRATRHEGTRDPDKQPHHHQKQRQSGGRCTRYGTMHPIRGAAPVQKRCIAYGSGAAPQYTRTNAELANRATPHYNQPEHRTPGGHRAGVGRLCCALGPHGARTRKEPRPRPTGIGDELRPETWTRLMVVVMRLAVGPDPGILLGSGP